MSAGRSTFTASLALVALALAGCSPDAAPLGPSITARPTTDLAGVPTEPLAFAWQERARGLVAANRLSALAAARTYAAVSVAQHRAVQAIDAGGGRRQLEARRGAVAGASARVLGAIFSAAAPSLDAEAAEQGEDGAGNVHPHFARGVVVGRDVGDAMALRLQGDRFTVAWTGPAPTGGGIFTPIVLPPAGGTFGNVVPYYMTSGSQFRPPPPPAFDSPEFAADLANVVSLTLNRSPEELALARKWDMPGGTPTPIGLWNSVAVEYASAAGLDERAATELLATMHAAMMDALIGCWDAKYTYWTIRPWQANGAVALALAPPNHPAYPSGHSCGSAAAGRVLAHYFPDHEDALEKEVEDAGFSRIVSGIHYTFDVTVGQALGRQVADLAIEKGAP